jgi:hypothetical protein
MFDIDFILGKITGRKDKLSLGESTQGLAMK